MPSPLIDIDDSDTWPESVREWMAPYVESLPVMSGYTSDLAVPLEREDEFRALVGDRLLAFHCTRLLDHELDAVRREGVRPLTRELVDERINAAHARGYLSDVDRARLRQRNVFALGAAQHREKRVCLVLGRAGLDDSGVHPLMSRWGGEAIYMADPDSTELAAFIGRPAVVVAAIDLSISHTVSPTFPSLGKLFVGAALGTGGRYADVLLQAPVPAADVLVIWQPGDADYDRHPTLPRE
jgi:hypothetical protein